MIERREANRLAFGAETDVRRPVVARFSIERNGEHAALGIHDDGRSAVAQLDARIRGIPGRAAAGGRRAALREVQRGFAQRTENDDPFGICRPQAASLLV